jgi:hypothetical protein
MTELDEHARHHLLSVTADALFHHFCTMCGEGFSECDTGGVLSGSSDHTVADREHFGTKDGL